MSVEKLLPVLESPRSAPARIVASKEKVVPPGIILAADVEVVLGASVDLVSDLEFLDDATALVGSTPSEVMLMEVLDVLDEVRFVGAADELCRREVDVETWPSAAKRLNNPSSRAVFR